MAGSVGCAVSMVARGSGIQEDRARPGEDVGLTPCRTGQLLASVRAQSRGGDRSPATRLIDREVKPPYVLCGELMGFCSPGQIPRIFLVPEHFGV